MVANGYGYDFVAVSAIPGAHSFRRNAITEEFMDYLNDIGYDVPDDYVSNEDIPTYTEPAATLEDMPDELLDAASRLVYE